MRLARAAALIAALTSGVAHALDLYAHTHAGMFSPAVRGVPARVYVPKARTIPSA